jgi:hypothetical protein
MFHGKSNPFSPIGQPVFTLNKTPKNPTKQFRAGVHHETVKKAETIACGGCYGERPLGKIAFIAKSWRALLGYYLRVSEKSCTAKLLQSHCKPNSEAISCGYSTEAGCCISAVKLLHRERQKRENAEPIACSGLQGNWVKNYIKKNRLCNGNFKTHGIHTSSEVVYCNRYQAHRKTTYFFYCNRNSEMIYCGYCTDLSYCKIELLDVFRKRLQLGGSEESRPSRFFRFRMIIGIPIRENRF